MNNSIPSWRPGESSRKSEFAPSKFGTCRTLLIGLFLTNVLLSSAFCQTGNSQDVRYSLSPIISGVAWNTDLGLKDGLFYGGKLGIDFGPLIGLEASYLTSDNLWTDFSGIGLLDTAGFLVGDQRVKVRRYGGDLIIRWPSDRLAPFVKVGGGAVRFEPVSGPKAEKIDVRVGGGLDYILTGRLRTRAWVEMSRFRLDRYALAPGGGSSGQYPIDSEADKIRNNLSVGLSLDYAIGQGRFRAVRTDERLRPFAALELEPMVGRLDFDDSRMPIVTVAGARLGGELNPWVGWGLYYWHAMESDLSDTRPLQSYGGEARFKLASTAGPQPYVTIGAGQLDFLTGYTDSEGTEREDRTALILGAGIRAEIFRGMQLNVGVRDLMYGEGRLDRVSGTDEISHNWLLSGALVFGIGGRGGDSKRQPMVPSSITLDSRKASERPDTVATDTKTGKPKASTKIDADTVASGLPTGYVSDKNVTIPVPLEGEIYIRYGKVSGDIEKEVVERVSRIGEKLPDSAGRAIPPVVVKSLDTTRVSTTVPSPDTTVLAPPSLEAEQPPPVSRRELDSLLNVLRSDIRAMLTSPAAQPEVVAVEPPPETIETSPAEDTVVASLRNALATSEQERRRLDSLRLVPTPPETTVTPLVEDSVVSALKRELAASEQERRRLDSLRLVPTPQPGPVQDTLAEQRIQQAIADQVAAELAARPEQAEKEITQADLQAMMAALTARMDSVTAQRTAYDSARLRDQLQLEIVRQTKSQEEFQRAMEDFVRQYGERQEDRAATPPAIVVAQPAPSPQVIDSDRPATVLVTPDTQYVVIRDSTSQDSASAPISGLTGTPHEDDDFTDLRPTGYTGFGLEKPKQFVLGGRLDIGPLTAREERFRLVPEFALGLGGGGVSVMAVMNVEYAITKIETGDYQIVPYARLGCGVLGFGGDISDRDTEGVLNFTYGFSVDTRKAGTFRGIGAPALFVEHQIIDLFDLNRIVLGMQWSR